MLSAAWFGFSRSSAQYDLLLFFHLAQGSRCLQSKKDGNFQHFSVNLVRRDVGEPLQDRFVMQGSCTGGLQQSEFCFLGITFSTLLMQRDVFPLDCILL